MTALTFKTELHDRYLRINVFGNFAFEAMMGLVDVFLAEARASERTSLLVDCSQMKGSVTEPNKYFIAEKIAFTFRAAVKAALVMPEGSVTKLGEIVAVNRGAHFFVTDSEPEALKWLVG